MSVVYVTNQEIVEKIGHVHAHGVFYSVTFEKKTDGSMRTMTCRGGVKKGLRLKKDGSESSNRLYDPTKYSLMNTFSIDSDGWRCFCLDNVKSAKIFGVSYVVK
jgi:hypothetical protein